LSPDGRFVAFEQGRDTGNGESYWHFVYDRMAQTRTYRYGRTAGDGIVFSPDGLKYLGTRQNRTIYDTITGLPIATLDVPFLEQAFWSNDGKSILTFSSVISPAETCVIDTATGISGPVASLEPASIAVEPSGRSLLMGNFGSGTRRIDTISGNFLNEYQSSDEFAYYGRKGSVCTVRLQEGGGAVHKEFSQTTGELRRTLHSENGIGWNIVERAGQNHSLTQHRNGRFDSMRYLYTDTQISQEFGPYPEGTMLTSTSGDGRWVVHGTAQSLDLIDLQGAMGKRTFGGDCGSDIALSRDGQWLACPKTDGQTPTLAVRKIQDMSLVKTLALPPQTLSSIVSWSPEGDVVWCLILTEDPYPTLIAIEWRTGRVLFQEKTNANSSGHSIDISPDGQHLVLKVFNKWVNVFKSPLAPDRSGFPTNYETVRGSWRAGTVASLFYADADRLTVRADDANGSDRTALKIIISGEMPVGDRLVSIRARFMVSKPGQVVNFSVYNWVSRKYVTVGSSLSDGSWQTKLMSVLDGKNLQETRMVRFVASVPFVGKHGLLAWSI